MINISQDEFAGFVHENQHKFYRLAYSYVKNRDEAHDLVQEAVVRALQKLSALRQPEYMKTWFYRILVNECLMYLRKRKIVNLPYEDELLSESVSTDLSSLEMLSCIEKLEPKLKTVVFLRFYEDMKLEEIANVTETNLSTVKSRLYRALKLLRLEIFEEESYLEKFKR